MQPNPTSLPAGLVPYRRTPTFDAASAPDALLADHSTKAGVWGLVHVERGTLRFRVTDPRRPDVERAIRLGDAPAIVEPEIAHRVALEPDTRFHVEFHRLPAQAQAKETTVTDTPLPLEGLDAMPPADAEAIAGTLVTLLTGFARRDAEPLIGVYADDADWVNAFGSVKRGRAEIVDYLRGLFADGNFNDGRMVAPPRSRLRRVTADVVAVSSHLRIEGQGLVGGGAIPVRDNRSLRVLARQPDGRWLIVSEMYMDANTEATYAGHS